MLSEDEEQAIEIVKKIKNIKFNITSSFYSSGTISLSIEEKEAINTVLNLITKLQKENEEKDKQIEKALDLIFQYGQIDGAHHKAWVIDQTVRILIKDKYDEWVKNYVYDEETGDTYSWDKGIAP